MWNPPPDVTEHNGEPLSPDLDSFAAFPAEIGAIRTPHTSLKKGMRERPVSLRAMMAVVAGVVGFLLTLGFEHLTKILFVVSNIKPVILRIHNARLFFYLSEKSVGIRVP